ncbi:MAG: hypothetical protein AAFN00_16850 [Cyanobacteria bacterium J06558_2]
MKLSSDCHNHRLIKAIYKMSYLLNQLFGRYKSKKYILILINLVFVLFIDTAKSQSQDNILVIHSYHLGYSWTKEIEAGIEEYFEQSQQDINIFHEFLDGKRYPDLPYSKSFLENIRQKYKNTPIDVVMVSDDPALDLVLQVREQYFAQAPIVFLGINHITQELLDTSGITGVFENRDVAATILKAYQQTKSDTLIVINDSTQTGQANLKKINEIEPAQNSFKDIEIINDLTPDQIQSKIGKFPKTTPIFFIGQLRENSAERALYNWDYSINILRAKVDNPIYGVTVELLDRGIVGGKFLEGKTHAKEAAQLTEKILQGSDPEDLKPILEAKNKWIFDAKAIKKYHINLKSIPTSSEIINPN